ncbi:MAG: hypothetical protein J0M20_01660 [Burkholderiales bacterium]|nr:hypothetical protein [Burkholderiales bacterium]
MPLSHPTNRPPLSLRIVPDLPVRHAGTLELVDSEFMATALDSRWHSDGDLADDRRDLLLLDPALRWAPAIMQALAETTGAPLARVRVLSPVALREVAVIDEIRLPREAGLPCIVRHLHTRRLEPDCPSPAMTRVWRRTRLAVMLADPLQDAEATRWVLMVAAQVRRLGEESPPWTVLGPPSAREAAAQGTPNPPWVQRMRFEPAPARGSVSEAWNAIFKAWQQVR